MVTIRSRCAIFRGKVKAPERIESKHTFQIKQLIEPFTLGLTKEQIDGITDAILPYIDEWLEELEKMKKRQISNHPLPARFNQ
jgi:hypothetical protein